jgi:hypothetical protein
VRANTAGPDEARAMAPLSDPETKNPRCYACDNETELTVLIPPFGNPTGLKIFTCPNCGRSQSFLISIAPAG